MLLFSLCRASTGWGLVLKFHSWCLSEKQVKLTSSLSLFQNPKSRPTFAELLQVLTEIAETWWPEMECQPTGSSCKPVTRWNHGRHWQRVSSIRVIDAWQRSKTVTGFPHGFQYKIFWSSFYTCGRDFWSPLSVTSHMWRKQTTSAFQVVSSWKAPSESLNIHETLILYKAKATYGLKKLS